MPSDVSALRVATLVAPALGRSPAYLALAEAVRDLVSDGRIPVGARLPSERELTLHLPVSRATVTRAYDVLREQRYLESRQGSGSVARLPVSRSARTDHLLRPADVAGSGLEPAEAIDLTTAPQPPPPGTMACFEAAVRRLPPYLAGTGYYPSGLPALQEAMAARFEARGLPTEPSQVIVVGGALAGVSIAAHALVGRGDRVLLEAPTYPNAIAAWRGQGGRVVTTPVEPGHGWDLAGVEASLRRHPARAAYLIPDFHNPTGANLDDDGRARLARALRRAGTVAVVDESLVDIVLDEPPDGVRPRPFAAHHRDTVTVGAASKSFWSGLRIGWIRVPPDRADAVLDARLALDLASPPVEQLALLELFAREDEIRAHQRAALLASRAALLGALGRVLPDWQVVPGAGGLSLWCRLPRPQSTALALAAESYGVYLAPGPRFGPGGGFEQHIRLPYTLPPERLVTAVDRLAQAWADAPAVHSGGRTSTVRRVVA